MKEEVVSVDQNIVSVFVFGDEVGVEIETVVIGIDKDSDVFFFRSGKIQSASVKGPMTS